METKDWKARKLVTNILLMFITVAATITTGRLSPKEFDATCLSLSFSTAYAMSPMTGACTACDTLFSQSMGSVNKKRTGLWLQKGLLILNVGNLLIGAIHLNLEPIFVLIGQDPEVSRLAAKFSAAMVPGMFFYTNLLVFLRFLQNIDCTYVPIFIFLFVNVVNAVIQYIAMFVYNAGYLAAAVSISISFALILLLEVAYLLIFKKYKGVWDGFHREALSEWGDFTKLSLYGVGHFAFESVLLNVGIILAGTISTTLLAAQSVLHQFENVLYMIPASISVSVNIRVGQSLGRADIKTALQCLKTCIVLNTIFVVCFSAVVMGLRNDILWLFTTHADVVKESTAVLPIMILVIGMDCYRGIVDGTMRGCGRQQVGAVINFFASYFVGLPLAIPLLLLTELRLTGYWLGMSACLTLSFILASVCLVRQNWQKEAVKAQTRVLFAAKQAMQAPRKKSEKTPLLPPSISIRTPREPRSCSTNFEVMKEHMNISATEFRALLIKRVITTVGLLLFFVASLVSNLAIPHDLYNPLSINTTLVHLSNTSAAFFNVTPA